MTVPAEQADIAALLRRLAGADARETPISAVFIGADAVFKLRKAVRLSFLDFSEIAERERTARREFTLNAPHAPGLYRGVRPILRRPDGTLALGDDDAAGDATVDWVVEMAPVPAGDFLDAIAARGGLDDRLLDATADAVAAYHAALMPAASGPPDATMRAIADGNVPSARAAGLPPQEIARWHAAIGTSLESLAAWQRQRAADGFVRRAHGDLHLGNLCLWRGKPTPFDALEFDERLGVIDVAYDVAFLLMDVEHRVGRAAANRVLNRYVARTGDHALVAGLPAFLSIRAMVRAHVEAASGHAAESRVYLDQALGYLRRQPAILVAIGGLPGSGKSTLARALAPTLGPAPGALILRSDEIRKRRFGAAPEQRLPEAAYAEAESRHVLADLATAAGEVVGCGHAAIADATFIDPADRTAIAAASGTAPFAGVWLHAAPDELERRVAARQGDASDATVDILRRILAVDPGPGDWQAVDSTGRDAALTALRRAVRDAAHPC